MLVRQAMTDAREMLVRQAMTAARETGRDCCSCQAMTDADETDQGGESMACRT